MTRLCIDWRCVRRTFFPFICPQSFTVMHPAYGVSYLEKMGWPKAWRDKAVDLAREEWTEHYRVETPSTDSSIEVLAPRTLFNELDVTLITIDPFEHFIASPPIPKAHCQQPLVWFGTISPYASGPSPNNKVLIRMAQDFLGAPATPVDVERAFSHGGGMTTKHRHALSAETIRANALVSAWHHDGLVPEEAAVKIFGSLQSRKKAKPIDLASDKDAESEASETCTISVFTRYTYFTLFTLST
ncbi:hypothetical protein GGX14DRAFT_367640 [Mycena pura]|uniref:HAT C-terminal dimerisation domain-containing protein n=1 Tax=Mycena pura TaxID=153505 RepID=A0AAD6V8Y0_9AGAR|nr:hypothetical protein GGX14DRAFT_367640 [Mycena pura]